RLGAVGAHHVILLRRQDPAPLRLGMRDRIGLGLDRHDRSSRWRDSKRARPSDQHATGTVQPPAMIASALRKSAGSIASPEAAAFSSSCSGRLAPTMAEATLDSRSTQAKEN